MTGAGDGLVSLRKVGENLMIDCRLVELVQHEDGTASENQLGWCSFPATPQGILVLGVGSDKEQGYQIIGARWELGNVDHQRSDVDVNDATLMLGIRKMEAVQPEEKPEERRKVLLTDKQTPKLILPN